MISFDRLTVRYGDAVALDGITGAASDVEWLAVIGPNGAGKTTLLNAIARLIPYSGAIMVGGRPARRLGRRELARLVAYVPPRPGLPPHMPVAQYAPLGRAAPVA